MDIQVRIVVLCSVLPVEVSSLITGQEEVIRRNYYFTVKGPVVERLLPTRTVGPPVLVVSNRFPNPSHWSDIQFHWEQSLILVPVLCL